MLTKPISQEDQQSLINEPIFVQDRDPTSQKYTQLGPMMSHPIKTVKYSYKK